MVVVEILIFSQTRRVWRSTTIHPGIRASRFCAPCASWGSIRRGRYGPVRVLGALGELSAELRRGGVRNPAGWLVAALSDRERVFEQAGADVLAHLQRPAETVRRWGLDAVFPEWRERAAALGER